MGALISSNYSIMTTVFLCTSHITSSEIIWRDLMNDDSTMNNWYSNVYITMMNNDNGCADQTGPCWRFCGSGTYIKTTVTTEGYNDIKLTFDVDPHYMTESDRFCVFSYSIDSTHWNPFYQINGGYIHIVNETQTLSNKTWNKMELAIKIEVVGADISCCFVSKFMLTGNTLSTYIPTSSTTSDSTSHSSKNESDHEGSKKSGDTQILLYIIAGSVLLNMSFIGLCIGFLVGRRRSKIERDHMHITQPTPILAVTSASIVPDIQPICNKDENTDIRLLEGCSDQGEEGLCDDDVDDRTTAHGVDDNNPNLHNDEFIIGGDDSIVQGVIPFTTRENGNILTTDNTEDNVTVSPPPPPGTNLPVQ